MMLFFFVQLETDEAVLLPHAKKALLKYGHQVRSVVVQTQCDCEQ